MIWFDYLKEKGEFDPAKNPDPVAVDKGIYTPWWDALNYLEKLALTFQSGKNLEAIDGVLDIIKSVSENPKDNYTTWYRFIKILTLIPNEKVPVSILQYIPVWLTIGSSTTGQSSELCNALLPKFLNDDPTTEDIQKASVIIRHLFDVTKRKDPDNRLNPDIEKYQPIVNLRFLDRQLEDDRTIKAIAKHCSTDLIDYLMNQIRLLLLENGQTADISFKSNERRYGIKAFVEADDALFILSGQHQEAPIDKLTVKQYYLNSEELLAEKINEWLDKNGLVNIEADYEPDMTGRLTYSLKNDFYSAFHSTPIHRLDDDDFRYNESIDSFATILRNLLLEKTKLDPEEMHLYLKSILGNPKFDLPFFRRIVLNIITKNWQTQRSLFWEMIGDNDKWGLFSSEKYQHELYYLLQKIHSEFTADEVLLMKNLLEAGPKKNKPEYEEPINYWQHRWYSALKDHPNFSDSFASANTDPQLKKKNYEDDGQIFVRVGNISPFTEEEVVTMSEDVLIKNMLEFRSNDRWEDPSIEGFAEVIKTATENHPQKFVTLLSMNVEIPYIYTYQIFYGLVAAWKAHRDFDWETVLTFCDNYISTDAFQQDKLKLENDGWNANKDWVLSTIGILITEGTRNDEYAYDSSLLPLTKKILLKIIPWLNPDGRWKKPEMDYPMYVVNSTSGKVLRALLDYSLRRARILGKEAIPVWEDDIRKAFDSTFEKKIIDGYILQGMYFEQFCFLDKQWILNNIEKYYTFESPYWEAFVNGLVFGRAHGNKEIYPVLRPHYKQAIIKKISFTGRYNGGIIRHLVSFYFWDIEDAGPDSLTLLFLNNAEPELIRELVTFIWQQEKYYKGLSESERAKLLAKIVSIWKIVSEKFQNVSGEAQQEVMCSLIHLMGFLPALDPATIELIKQSAPLAEKRRYHHELFEELIRLKRQGNPSETAGHIAAILDTMPFKQYLYESEEGPILELIQFLYANNQKAIANNICNKVAINGQDFLKMTYQTNNS